MFLTAYKHNNERNNEMIFHNKKKRRVVSRNTPSSVGSLWWCPHIKRLFIFCLWSCCVWDISRHQSSCTDEASPGIIVQVDTKIKHLCPLLLLVSHSLCIYMRCKCIVNCDGSCWPLNGWEQPAVLLLKRSCRCDRAEQEKHKQGRMKCDCSCIFKEILHLPQKSVNLLFGTRLVLK